MHTDADPDRPSGKATSGTPRLGWRRDSWVVLSAFLVTIGLIAVVWWPLAEEALGTIEASAPWWHQVDWLLVGDFLAMSVLVMVGADLRRDIPIALVGLAGGLAIEGWGTQTGLWSYYTGEAPPLWILPAWPIAGMAWDRLARLLDRGMPKGHGRAYTVAYWVIWGVFLRWLILFAAPTLAKLTTVLAVLACALLALANSDRRMAVLTFAAGVCLGYFLELWGTTRECWAYYTRQTPPAFAVVAHGVAAVAFWRCRTLIGEIAAQLAATLRSTAGADQGSARAEAGALAEAGPRTAQPRPLPETPRTFPTDREPGPH